MVQVKKLATTYDAILSGYDVAEYDENFGDDYLKCNDLSTNRRGFNLLKIDETKNNLEKSSDGIELVVLIGRDDIETIENYENIEVKVVINASMPKNGEIYDLYLPMLTHMSREGSFINIDGFLQFSKAKVEYVLETQSLSKIVSTVLGDNISTCKEIWEESLKDIVHGITLKNIKKESIKMSSS
jgi:NADH-quinone oxidoreductase subunit G